APRRRGSPRSGDGSRSPPPGAIRSDPPGHRNAQDERVQAVREAACTAGIPEDSGHLRHRPYRIRKPDAYRSERRKRPDLPAGLSKRTRGERVDARIPEPVARTVGSDVNVE